MAKVTISVTFLKDKEREFIIHTLSINMGVYSGMSKRYVPYHTCNIHLPPINMIPLVDITCECGL